MRPETSGFVLAAAITVLFNTALAWAKDASPRLTAFMKSVAGHQWTTHGLADLLVFVVLGVIFAKTKIAEKVNSELLIGTLIASVVVAVLGLALWYSFL